MDYLIYLKYIFDIILGSIIFLSFAVFLFEKNKISSYGFLLLMIHPLVYRTGIFFTILMGIHFLRCYFTDFPINYIYLALLICNIVAFLILPRFFTEPTENLKIALITIGMLILWVPTLLFLYENKLFQLKEYDYLIAMAVALAMALFTYLFWVEGYNKEPGLKLQTKLIFTIIILFILRIILLANISNDFILFKLINPFIWVGLIYFTIRNLIINNAFLHSIILATILIFLNWYAHFMGFAFLKIVKNSITGNFICNPGGDFLDLLIYFISLLFFVIYDYKRLSSITSFYKK